MTFYNELQLNQAGSKNLINNSKCLKEKKDFNEMADYRSYAKQSFPIVKGVTLYETGLFVWICWCA